jgi:transketolase
LSGQWKSLFAKYRAQYPDLAAQFERMQTAEAADGWDKDLPTFAADAKGLATRDSSSKVLNVIAKNEPWLMGGSADLYPSTKTRLTFDGADDFEANHYNARNFHFGIREHSMGAIVNGMVLSKIRGYGSTFLIFSDYMKMPIRLSAVMEIPSIWTDPLISPLSNWSRCARFPDSSPCGPPMPTKLSRRGKSSWP